MNKPTQPPDYTTIEEVHQRISQFTHRTPVMSSASINNILNCKIFFKCENFHKVGAFKFGGVCNAILETKIDVTGKTIGIILSRGNVGLQKTTFLNLILNKAYLLFTKISYR